MEINGNISESILARAKPKTKTKDGENNKEDGDWGEVFLLIERNKNNYMYLATQDKEGNSVLHYACDRVKRQRAKESAEYILHYVKKMCERLGNEKLIEFVNLKEYKENKTALQLATDNRNKPLVKLLIENRANIFELKPNSKLYLETIHMIYDKVLINIFDQSLKIHKAKDDLENESLWKIECDFSPITGTHISSETNSSYEKKQMHHLAMVLRRETATRETILQHPLVQIFLHLKGEKFTWLLYTSMVYHIIWSLISFVFIFCNTHILESTNIENTSRSSNLTQLCQPFRIYQPGTIKFHTSGYFYIMIILYVGSVGKEFAELYTCPERWYYWKQLENLGQWVVNATILIVWLVTLVTGLENLNTEEGEETFLKENTFVWTILLPGIFIFGMFASLLLIQGQLTKTEFLGIYNEMFAKGFWNIIKFILAFLPLLIAFLITFHLLLPMRKEFLPDWGLSFAKIITMMTGELGYDDVFYGEDEEEIAFNSILKVLFVVFTVTVVILLQNLLIGMTVSDVQMLEKDAKVNNLASRLEDLFLLENLVTNPLILKLLNSFKLLNLDRWFKKSFILEKVDPKKEKCEPYQGLDEYPQDIRKKIIEWDNEKSGENNGSCQHVVVEEDESATTSANDANDVSPPKIVDESPQHAFLY